MPGRCLYPSDRGLGFGSIRLHHASAEQGRAAEAGNPEEHFPVVLPRREDRCARPQRRGQVDPAAHHGRRRQGVRRRSPSDAGHQCRLPAPGAAAGREQDRPRGRRGSGERDQGCPGTPGRGLRRLRRAGCRLRQAGCRAGQARSDPAGLRRPQPERQLEVAADALRLPPWDAKIEHLSGGEKRRVALCRLLLSAPTCCCWTNRPTTWMPTRWLGWSTSCTTSRDRGGDHPRPLLLDNVAGWILELDRGAGIPYEGNYSGWLEAKSARLEQESSSRAPTNAP